MNEIKLYIFDMNGTLSNTPFVDKVPLALLPGRKEKIAQLQASGARCAIASNQGGVAFGFTTEDEATAEIAGIAAQLNIDLYAVAFGHPKPKYGYEEYANAYHMGRRKPKPGMLIDLMSRAEVYPADTLMIGDREEDQQAAEGANVPFLWAKDFFAEPGELVVQIYQLYQQTIELLENKELALLFTPSGAGQIQWTYHTLFVAWPSLVEAPGYIQAAIEEHKKASTPVASNDFDPFLDPDDLP